MNRKRQGFTLVELLIVFALVFILASLFFAVFSRVQEKGRQSVCLGNLQQIFLAMQQYVQDNNGYYPSLSVSQTEWVTSIQPYVHSQQVFVCSSASQNITNGLIPNVSYDYHIIRLNHGASRPVFESRNESNLSNSSKIWLNTDKDPLRGFNDEARPFPNCNWWSLNWGQALHSGGANYSFVDGHIKWLTPQQIAGIECGLGEPQFNRGG